MAFRVEGPFKMSVAIQQRMNRKHPFSTYLVRMSSSSTSAPPPPRKPVEEPGSSGRTVITAIGGLMAIGGLGFIYKSYTDDNFTIGNNVKWIREKIGWEETKPKVVDKVLLQKDIRQKLNQSPKTTDIQNFASTKVNNPANREDSPIQKTNPVDLKPKEIQEPEKILSGLKPKVIGATETALKAYAEAAENIQLFMDKTYRAIEEDAMESPRFEELWEDVHQTSLKRCEKVKDAIAKAQLAWDLVFQLRKVIEDGKTASNYAQGEAIFNSAEEALLGAERGLLSAKSHIDCIQSESRLVEQYRNLVEEFRRELKTEVEHMLASNPKGTFTDNETAMILTHAYKKVFHIQKELSEVQMTAFSDEFIPNDASSGLVLQMKIDENRKYYESELLKTLARQAQVYQENFTQIKATMQEEFDRRLKQKADIHESESLVELRTKSHQASAALDAMVQNLQDRKNHDDRAESLRKLWSYCNAVYGRINYANFGVEGTADKVVINKGRLLKEFSNDEFAIVLLKTIPDVVGSSESLKERFFNKIDKTCRQVAIFKVEEKISLWKYFLGYIQGSLVTRCDGDKATSKDVYELLDRTGYHLRRGEILDAVATLSKMKGIPRQVCEDWLNDAVSVLEASQTLYALMTHVNANSVYQKPASS